MQKRNVTEYSNFTKEEMYDLLNDVGIEWYCRGNENITEFIPKKMCICRDREPFALLIKNKKSAFYEKLYILK